MVYFSANRLTFGNNSENLYIHYFNKLSILSTVHYIFKLTLHIGILFPTRIKRIRNHLVTGFKFGLFWFIDSFESIFRIQQIYIGFRLFEWSIRGVKSIFTWLHVLLLMLIELIGVGEILMILWSLIFKMRSLSPIEIQASKTVHSEGLIPYDLIRVNDYSWLSRISRSAICSIYVIHLEENEVSLSTMIHELTHVAQYTTVGAIYMLQAIIAQNKYGRYGGHGSQSAYDYERVDTLDVQIQKGQNYSDLNREAQAELVQDYFTLMQNKCPIPETFEYFMNQMRERRF